MLKFSSATIPSFEHPESNEDAYFIDEKKQVVGIFDGISGQAAGGVACNTANKIIEKEIRKLDDTDEIDALTKKIKKAFFKADEEIRKLAHEIITYSDMATTGCLVKIIKNQILVANVGDSRVYLKRKKKKIKQLTVDDSYVQELVDAGQISKNEASIHPYRNIVTQTLGVGFVEPKIYLNKTQAGDIILLCTDGLYDNMSDEEIADNLKNVKNLAKIAYQVSQRTTARSKPDDITAITIEI